MLVNGKKSFWAQWRHGLIRKLQFRRLETTNIGHRLRRTSWGLEVRAIVCVVAISQWREAVVISWKMFAESAQEPWKLGWMPSLLNKLVRSQNRLKWSMNVKLSDGQIACNHVCSLLKRPLPRPSVGIGPDFLSLLNRQLKSCFRTSDCCLVMSFVPIWTITLWHTGVCLRRTGSAEERP